MRSPVARLDFVGARRGGAQSPFEGLARVVKTRLDGPGGNPQHRRNLLHVQILTVKQVHRGAMRRLAIAESPSRGRSDAPTSGSPLAYFHQPAAASCVEPPPTGADPDRVGALARRNPVDPGRKLGGVA